MHRRDFILTISSLFLSSCAQKYENIPFLSDIPQILNYSIFKFPEELENFLSNQDSIKNIFSTVEKENPILSLVKEELSSLKKEINRIISEKVKLDGKTVFENILIWFFNILKLYLLMICTTTKICISLKLIV